MMKRPAKCRRQRSFNADISKRIDTLVVRPVAAQSAILADAVRAWPSKRGTQEFDDQIGHSLASCACTLSRAEPTISPGSETP
jgi:hypothetical protein